MLHFPTPTFIVFILSCSVLPDAFAALNSSKTGLAWPNGNWDNIEQYASTGMGVSWYVLVACLLTGA